jgi:hypothetical protein
VRAAAAAAAEEAPAVCPVAGTVSREKRRSGALRERLLREALRRGFSRDGEMFCLDDLLALARDECGLEAASWLPPGELSCASVERALAGGARLLIAYDVDGGFSPQQAGGARAHWAVLCGFLRGCDADGDAHVVLVHSMSRVPVVCDLRDLVASNAQLVAARDSRWLVTPGQGPRLGGAIVVPSALPPPVS